MNKHTMNIVILDGYGLNPGDLSWDAFEALGACTVYPRTAPEEVVSRALGADVLLTNKTVLTAAHMAALPTLKYIGVLATGYNVVDLEAAHARGIVVTNIPAYSTDSVAQMAFAHLLHITQRVGHYAQENARGRWASSADFCYWDYPLTELAGKVCGIVGYGHTGQATARIALAFGMQVRVYTSKPQSALPAGVLKSTLEDVFAQSDVVSLHCPLTPDTHHLVNAAHLATMKPTAILLNTGRGPLVDEAALADALSAGRLRAAGVDVLATEPPAADNPLLSAPNCFVTPHIAWATLEARTRLMHIAADNLQAFLRGEEKNRV
jgi:glycerate dehydrogenase